VKTHSQLHIFACCIENKYTLNKYNINLEFSHTSIELFIPALLLPDFMVAVSLLVLWQHITIAHHGINVNQGYIWPGMPVV
jgi:hypothetical protein